MEKIKMNNTNKATNLQNLSDKKIGIIGTGKMGESLIKGILNAKIIQNNNIYASDLYEPSLKKLKNDHNINVSIDNSNTILNSDIIILAVKPDILKNVLLNIKDEVGSKLIISIAAGVSTVEIEANLNDGAKVIRVMPNIAATVMEAASAISKGNNASNIDANIAVEIFKMVGNSIEIKEHLMDAFTGLSGSGIAYIFPVIEAMADGAVYEGLDRAQATMIAAQTVLGAAKMVLETGMHPGQLKDMVTSPSGTTIRGIYALEECGIRNAFMDAVISSSVRSKELMKQS